MTKIELHPLRRHSEVKTPPYPPPCTFSDSLKKRSTWRLNLTSLSTASKVLSQTAAALHIHSHIIRAHTPAHHHAPTSQWSAWERGPDNLDGPASGSKHLYGSECVCVCRMKRGSVATCPPMTADPVTTNARVLCKHQADHHFPSSVTLSSPQHHQRILPPKTNTWRK